MIGRLIQYGDYIDVISYDRVPDFKRKKEWVTSDCSDVVGIKNKDIVRKPWEFSTAFSRRSNNIIAVKKHFRKLVIDSLAKNGTPLLITFTFNFDCTDASEGFKYFRLAMQRLRTHYGPSFLYIAVPEWQPVSGRIHYHALVWGLPMALGDTYHPTAKHLVKGKLVPILLLAGLERSSRVLASIWQNGYVDCRKTDGSEKLATYLTKYLSKVFDNPLLLRIKAFTRSRNFGNYTVIRTDCLDTLFDYCVDDTFELIYTTNIITRYFGCIKTNFYKKHGTDNSSR